MRKDLEVRAKRHRETPSSNESEHPLTPEQRSPCTVCSTGFMNGCESPDYCISCSPSFERECFLWLYLPCSVILCCLYEGR